MTSESVSKDDDTAAGHTVNAPQGPSWKPVARSSTHELVINAIEEQITSGSLTVGDPLPSERELAAKLQVSRAAVREALRVMESLGVIVSHVGSGKSAGTFIASMPKEALTRFLRLHVALANFSIEEAIETRIQLERSSTALATGRVHDDALAGMNASLAIMDTPGVSLETFNDADTAFHVAIARASENQLLSDLTEAIRGSLRRPILIAFHEVDDPRALMAQLQGEHHAIMRAIVDRDTDHAVQLTEDHIRSAAAALPHMTQKPAPPR
ncbi:MAG: FadR/GntR family transcriptional regulator [Brevibacterium aurantiacum]|uniref:GntR family transcriptional regulator n=2 Tax=Brevibacterium aurantiacum TaxID=273384 RepID=A0A2A3Z5V5_BREAU|nr:FCD domain-containing protein [Brevibacterium aurantiacum]AZL07046.1 FadR family transcriptional regulator [Brevibacterium aurantiacum]PCC46956.1 GntR family transcriptional regulator [Brevibacterium aurantiacum]RCS98287.1 FadR family transcriptional regulator [Brevibacterium aurantiacum]